jgi:predicted nucleotidyltransferase
MLLSPAEETILNAFIAALKASTPEAVKVIVFGSRARGSSDEGSDLDVAVVLSTDKIGFHHWQKLWNTKWEVLQGLQAEEFPLSLIPVTEDELSRKHEPFFKELRDTGVVLWERTLQRQS